MSATTSDAATIDIVPASLADRLARFQRAAPIVLDLDGNGVTTLSAAKTTTRFDWDKDGLADDTSWIGATEGFLMLDRDANGRLTDAGELSFIGDVEGATSDLAGLVAFDSNKDGILSALDARFADFRVWQDRNGNGATDTGEILTLTAAGVRSLNFAATAVEGAATPGEVQTIAKGRYTRTNGTAMDYIDATVTYFSAPRDGLPKLEFAPQIFERKSSKHRLVTKDGVISIGDNKGRALEAVDSRAGGMTGSFEMTFKNGSYGILTPLVLDLDGDGVSLKKVGKTKGWFDMNGDGVADKQGWISARDGFLVVDRNNNGKIDNGAELSLLAENPTANSSLEALATFDSNGDRLIDASDARFGELRLWVDANSNGVTDSGELKTLKDMGIESIGLAENFINGTRKVDQNFVFGTSVFKRTNGTQGTVGDVALSYRPSKPLPVAAITAPPADATPPVVPPAVPVVPDPALPPEPAVTPAIPDPAAPVENGSQDVFSPASIATLGSFDFGHSAPIGPAPLPTFAAAANLFGSAIAAFGVDVGTAEINGIVDPLNSSGISLLPNASSSSAFGRR